MEFSIKELNELIYSLGTTASKGAFCDKELNASLLDKLHCELNFKLSWEDDEIGEEDWLENRLSEDSFPHYVTNDEADEEFRLSLMQDEQMYVNGKYIPKTNGATQAILNFVEKMGFASYGQMNDEYRRLTGSNSFSHILKALIIPYKNRPSRRYLRQVSRGVYIVDIATPQNWIVKNK
jgi:hypothetical protein